MAVLVAGAHAMLQRAGHALAAVVEAALVEHGEQGDQDRAVGLKALVKEGRGSGGQVALHVTAQALATVQGLQVGAAKHRGKPGEQQLEVVAAQRGAKHLRHQRSGGAGRSQQQAVRAAQQGQQQAVDLGVATDKRAACRARSWASWAWAGVVGAGVWASCAAMASVCVCCGGRRLRLPLQCTVLRLGAQAADTRCAAADRAGRPPAGAGTARGQQVIACQPQRIARGARGASRSGLGLHGHRQLLHRLGAVLRLRAVARGVPQGGQLRVLAMPARATAGLGGLQVGAVRAAARSSASSALPLITSMAMASTPCTSSCRSSRLTCSASAYSSARWRRLVKRASTCSTVSRTRLAIAPAVDLLLQLGQLVAHTVLSSRLHGPALPSAHAGHAQLEAVQPCQGGRAWASGSALA